MTGDNILAIVGSTTFAYPGGEAVARRIIHAELLATNPNVVVSGGAVGVDTIAVAVAAHLGIPVREFQPKAHRWGAVGGFRERNRVIAGTCTRALRIVCATSTTYGSGWTVDRAERQGKPVRRVVIAADGSVTDSGWPKTTHHQEGLPL